MKNQFIEVFTAVIVTLYRFFMSTLKSLYIFPKEIYFFFSGDIEKKIRPHWMRYVIWCIFTFAYALVIEGALTSAFIDGTWLSFMKNFVIAGFVFLYANLYIWIEDRLAVSGNWLAWYPSKGWLGKDENFYPMPWSQLTNRLPFQLGPYNTLYRVRGGANNNGNTVSDRLPWPLEIERFALGAANVGEKVLRGTKIEDGYAYRTRLESIERHGLDSSLLTFGAVPLPFEAEPQHLMISGKSGAGKTQEINAILRTARYVRQNGALIADPAGGYLARFGCDLDYVLNPFDQRTQNWSPFAEIEYEYDCAIIAKATIPDGEGSSSEWNHYAQTLLTEVLTVLWKREEKSALRVLYYCASAPVDELAQLLDGTPAAAMTQTGNERMLANVRGIISTYMGAWRYLKDDGDFSVREFVRQSDQQPSFLFMTYQDAQMATLKHLIATWMELAIIEGLSMSESYSRRLWLVMDELDSLGKISSLKAGLTKLRKYGVCCVCGIQTIAQLRSTYGREDAQTLLSCMATKLILPPGDNETADYMSKELGDQTIERLQTSSGISTQSGQVLNNTSSNEHMHRETQRAVMASQLMSLPNRHGYLRMPGSDVFQVVIPYVDMPNINEPYEAAQ